MTQSKLLKLAKNLNKFSFDELLIISEESEESVKEFITEAVENKNIRKIDEELYLFISFTEKLQKPNKLVKTERGSDNKSFNPQTIEDIINPETHRKDYEIFKNEPEYSQRKILKYLLLFKAARDLNGNALVNFIKLWNERYPGYQTSQTSFRLNKKKYAEYGIQGLIRQKPYNKDKMEIPDDLYYRFRELYVSPNGLSVAQCVNIIKKKIQNLNLLYLLAKHSLGD
jgi:hypothetical protein